MEIVKVLLTRKLPTVFHTFNAGHNAWPTPSALGMILTDTLAVSAREARCMLCTTMALQLLCKALLLLTGLRLSTGHATTSRLHQSVTFPVGSRAVCAFDHACKFLHCSP